MPFNWKALDSSLTPIHCLSAKIRCLIKVETFCFSVAVNWALRKEVDIISMSWTIDKNDPNTQATDEFKKAISQSWRFSQVSVHGVFKIGSATKTGNLVKAYSGDTGNVQFILLSLNALVNLDKESKALSGISIATALISGLAALIILCADPVDQDRGKKPGCGQCLQQAKTMKAAFQRMGDKGNEEKYPEVHKIFT
ncbi:hypothetical protein P170DRAFT_427448 [Aspergillus steynii IBT 23096]|uniref:Peptidase S8/S53 domain-containing protein n=1 Tax=Aspergillus steynii IBT 23096 TaxID=1392250 RepID=A0A2I2G656_9EURO|nr:uncharacterized protein P170DRAFT_427448 [Aspergillus steynii IBT 23096]PLB48361.1 hypothetical protein P170DRAFT_427448 [Aspergillus steynii IBT 23096]